MKTKALLLLITSSIACFAENPKNNFIPLRENPQTGLWEQVTTQRPPEQDLQASFPWFGGKRFQINLTQIGNLAIPVASIPLLVHLNFHLGFCYNEKCPDHTLVKKISVMALNTAVLTCAYRYLTGEQEWPFRIINSQESSAPKNQTSEDELNA